MPEITHARVLEAVNYDSETGFFTWRIKTGKSVVVGKRAGSVDPNGFRYVRIDKKDFLAQRLAWFYVNGEWPVCKLRHRDDDRDNNAYANLVEVNGSGKFKGEFDHYTKEGKAAYGRAHREANPDLYRERYLTRDFGLTLADYQRMHDEQNGVCAICSQPETEQREGKVKWLAVDHDHTTDAVRGLLCQACNKAIGLLRESPDLFQRAVDYLKKYAAQDNRDAA